MRQPSRQLIHDTGRHRAREQFLAPDLPYPVFTKKAVGDSTLVNLNHLGSDVPQPSDSA
jgi:hypothetical protein